MAYTETGSSHQVREVNTDDKERKKLQRSRFAFGSIYPYTFDGLAYIATYNPKLFRPGGDNYYVLENIQINDWCNICLGEYRTHSKEHFIHELLRRGSPTDKDEAKNLRCIPKGKGKYISFQPLMIGFEQKTQEELSTLELKRMTNLRTFNEDTQKITTVSIYVLRQLVSPLFKKHSKGGWFPCPSALQAKIKHTLKTDEQHLFDGLEPLFLRKYFLYLNLHDGSYNDNVMKLDATDLCEHVVPAEINADGYIRNWNRVREKLTKANEFFEVMETQGLMKGAKAYPTTCLKGVYYEKLTKKFHIHFRRDPQFTFKARR
jgi:hypothetical protein